MTRQELSAAISRYQGGARFERGGLGRVLKALDDSVANSPSTYNLFELAVDSRDPARLQVDHIHRYEPLPPEKKSLLTARKIRGVLAALDAIHRGQGPGFDQSRIERLLELFKINESAYNRVLFSFEWDCARGRFEKITLYGFIEDIGQKKELCRILGLEWGSKSDVVPPDLDNIGVDFRPDGSRQLKIYRRRPYSPSLIRAGRDRAAACALHRILPVRDFARMVRLNSRGQAERGSKWGLKFLHKTTIKDLLKVPLLKKRHERFLTFTVKALGTLEISYVAFEGEALLLYGGRKLDGWMKWIQR